MFRVAAVYLPALGAFVGLLAAFRAPITPVAVLLPLVVWPELATLTGLDKLGYRAAWFCRIVGMSALLWVFIAKFIRYP